MFGWNCGSACVSVGVVCWVQLHHVFNFRYIFIDSFILSLRDKIPSIIFIARVMTATRARECMRLDVERTKKKRKLNNVAADDECFCFSFYFYILLLFCFHCFSSYFFLIFSRSLSHASESSIEYLCVFFCLFIYFHLFYLVVCVLFHFRSLSKHYLWELFGLFI